MNETAEFQYLRPTANVTLLDQTREEITAVVD
jgi:hypothetical protein